MGLPDQSAACVEKSVIILKYWRVETRFNFCRGLFSDEPFSGENLWSIVRLFGYHSRMAWTSLKLSWTVCDGVQNFILPP